MVLLKWMVGSSGYNLKNEKELIGIPVLDFETKLKNKIDKIYLSLEFIIDDCFVK